MRVEPLIMVVEDSPEDYEALLRAAKKACLSTPLVRCESGDEALEYLFHQGRYQDAAMSPRPSMILLDLNLPGTDGRQVLHALKSDSLLRTIPVIILTTSRDELDIQHCYAEGANSYVQKPIDMARLVVTLEHLSNFWLDVAILPESPTDPR